MFIKRIELNFSRISDNHWFGNFGSIFHSQWRVLFIFSSLHLIPSFYPSIKANCLLKIWLRADVDDAWFPMKKLSNSFRILCGISLGKDHLGELVNKIFGFLLRAFTGVSCTNRYNSDSVIKIYTKKMLVNFAVDTLQGRFWYREKFCKESRSCENVQKMFSAAIVNEKLSGIKSPWQKFTQKQYKVAKA